MNTIYHNQTKSHFHNLSETQKTEYAKTHWIHKDGKVTNKHFIGRLLNKWIVTRFIYRRFASINLKKTIQGLSEQKSIFNQNQNDFNSTCDFFIDVIQHLSLKHKDEHIRALQELKFTANPVNVLRKKSLKRPPK